MAQDYTLNVNVKGVDQAIAEVNDLTQSIEEASEATEDVGKGGGEGFKKLSKGLGAAKKGFGALRGAIIATGIGALVTLLGALVSKLMENKKVMEIVERATAGLGAVFGVIMDAIMPLGDMMIAAFNNPQEAITGMKDKMIALGDYIWTFIKTYYTPLRMALIKIKEGALQAAIGIKEFFGGDATNLRKQLEETQQDFEDLKTEFSENLDTLAEPFVKAGEAIAEMSKKAAEAADAAVRLKEAQQALRDSNRQLEVDYARAAASIEELKMKRDDERLSLEQRADAAREAAALDAEFARRRIEAADKEAKHLQREIELQGETEERLDALKDAQIAAADARAASAAVQTELMTSLYSLEQERIAQAEEVAAMERELSSERMTEREAEMQAIRDQLTERLATIDKLKTTEEEKEQLRVKARENADSMILELENQYAQELIEAQDKVRKTLAEKQRTAREKEAFDLEEHYNTLAEQAGDNATLVAEVEQARLDARREMFQRFYDEDQKANKANNDAKFKADMEALQATNDLRTKAATDTFTTLTNLNQLFSKKMEEGNKKAFERNKAISIAETLVSTYLSAQKAYLSQLTATPDSPIRAVLAAAAATASGLARVAAIKSTQFNSGGSTGGGGGGGGGISGGGVQSVGVDVGSLIPTQQTPTPEPVRAYVVENEISNKQALNRELQIQTTL